MRIKEEIMGEANAQNMKYKHLEVLLDIRELLAERCGIDLTQPNNPK